MKSYAWNKQTGEVREVDSFLTGLSGMETDHPGLPGDGWVYPHSTGKDLPRRVQMTKVKNVRVFTSFIGYAWDDPPRVFETMVCDESTGAWSEWQKRHAAQKDAMKFHESVVTQLRAGKSMNQVMEE